MTNVFLNVLSFALLGLYLVARIQSWPAQRTILGIVAALFLRSIGWFLSCPRAVSFDKPRDWRGFFDSRTPAWVVQIFTLVFALDVYTPVSSGSFTVRVLVPGATLCFLFWYYANFLRTSGSNGEIKSFEGEASPRWVWVSEFLILIAVSLFAEGVVVNGLFDFREARPHHGTVQQKWSDKWGPELAIEVPSLLNHQLVHVRVPPQLARTAIGQRVVLYAKPGLFGAAWVERIVSAP